MAIVIVEGKHGLFYGTETTNDAVFVTAKTEATARKFVEDAADGVLEGTIVIPSAEDQTPEQRQETIDQLTKHLRKNKH